MHYLYPTSEAYVPTSNSMAEEIIPTPLALYANKLQKVDNKIWPYDVFNNLGPKYSKPLPNWMDIILKGLRTGDTEPVNHFLNS